MSAEIALKKYLEELYGAYISMTKKSREYFERARDYLPGGVSYSIRYFEPHPLVVQRGKGPYVWDVDGNRYVDFWMGHGVNILGHSPDFLREAISEAVERGVQLGFETPYAIEFAEFLVRTLPGVEKIRFCNTGTESNMYALRLARACTGRKYVVKIEGGWHGGLDQLHVGVHPPFNAPDTLGLPEEYVKYTLLAPFNDLNAIERLLREHDVAAVLVEPVLGAGGCIEPLDGYLEGLRKLTEEHGSLLVFDEVITGFRLAYGGAQEYFGVRADIVVYGKIIGGGLPGAGGFGGRSECMEYLDQVRRPSSRERSGHGGTFVGNSLSMIAGYALVKFLHEHRGQYASFNDLWRRASKELDRVCEEHDRLCWVTGTGNLVGVHFTRSRPTNVRQAYLDRWSSAVYDVVHAYMRVNGILYMTPHMFHLLPSMAHSREHVEELVRKFEEAIERVHKLVRSK